MTLYTDSSALIKRYVAEDDRDTAESVLLADSEWVAGRHTFVENMLAIHRRLGDAERTVASAAFERDWQRTFAVALFDAVRRRAAELGIATGARSLDALHRAAAERAGGPVAAHRDLRCTTLARGSVARVRHDRGIGFARASGARPRYVGRYLGPVDRDPNTYGIRAPNSCRAR